MTIGDLLEALYASEINVELRSFWDGGWTAQLGDDLNMYGAEVWAQTLTEMVPKLREAAAKTYPDSHFSRRERGEIIVGPWNELQRYAKLADFPVACLHMPDGR